KTSSARFLYKDMAVPIVLHLLLLWQAHAQTAANQNNQNFQPPGFQNRYYQASGYQGSRVLEHNQTNPPRFNQYVEVLWPAQTVVDETGQIWIVDARYHQVLLMKTTSRYVSWPAFYTEYAGTRGLSGYVDGSRLKARFNAPSGLVISTDPRRPWRIYIADSGNHCIRVVAYESGRIATVAGSPVTKGWRDGPGQEAKFEQPSSLGMDPEGLHLFVLDNFRRIRYIQLYLKKKTVSTLVGGACRAVARWTVYESIVQRRVGCHPDWSATLAGEQVDVYVSGEGIFKCTGHQATCAPRNHPALADRVSTQLLSKAYAQSLLEGIPPEDPYDMPLVLPPASQ
ncbi:NHL repeat-containing protein 2, partial [Durusdinium trenchii]